MRLVGDACGRCRAPAAAQRRSPGQCRIRSGHRDRSLPDWSLRPGHLFPFPAAGQTRPKPLGRRSVPAPPPSVGPTITFRSIRRSGSRRAVLPRAIRMPSARTTFSPLFSTTAFPQRRDLACRPRSLLFIIQMRVLSPRRIGVKHCRSWPARAAQREDGMTVETVQLRAGDSGVDIVPAIGGGIAAYWTGSGDARRDWLRPAASEALAAGSPLGLANFPLTPFSNRIREGRFRFRGREVALPLNTRERHQLHGHGWQRPWTVLERSATRCVLVDDYAADAWPFPYRARQEFELSPAGFDLVLS
ncbi:hypothetical protein FFK22_031375, partial [Mycobacterium sp. KBS0706]